MENLHKWMLVPIDAAFLYARRDDQPIIEPLGVSWGYHPTPDITTGSRFVDLLQWTGTEDPSAALAVPDAIQFMEEHCWEDVRRECHGLLKQAIERICELAGMPPLYPLDSELSSHMGIAALPYSDLSRLKRGLYEEFRVEVPLVEWQKRHSVRISIQAYNTQEDVDALVRALETLLPPVQG